VVSNITNFSIIGENSEISCNENVGITFINVTNIKINGISLMHCNKDYNQFFNRTHIKYMYIHENNITSHHWVTAIHIHNCALVFIINVSILVDVGENGLLLTNVFMRLNELVNVTVQVNCLLTNGTNSTVITNGIMIVYFDWNNKTDSSILIENYKYKQEYSCLIYTALQYINLHCRSCFNKQYNYKVNITVINSMFKDLQNAAVLNFYGASIGVKARSRFAFQYCQFYRNANNSVALLKIIIHNKYIFEKQSNTKLYRNTKSVNFMHCNFLNDSNINMLLYINLINTLITNVNITIKNSNFSYNNAMQIIRVASEVSVLWHLSYFINFENVVISFNMHENGISLLSASNGIVSFFQNIVIKNNTNYYPIIHLHLSLLKLYGQCKIFYNQVRHIVFGSEGSYYLLKEYSLLEISQNMLCSVLLQSLAYNERYQKYSISNSTAKKEILIKWSCRKM